MLFAVRIDSFDHAFNIQPFRSHRSHETVLDACLSVPVPVVCRLSIVSPGPVPANKDVLCYNLDSLTTRLTARRRKQGSSRVCSRCCLSTGPSPIVKGQGPCSGSFWRRTSSAGSSSLTSPFPSCAAKQQICWTRLSMRLTDDGGSPAEPGRGCRNNLLLEHAWRAVPIANREAVLHLGGRNGHHAGMSESWSTSKACPGTHGLHGGPLLLVGLYPPIVAASFYKADYLSNLLSSTTSAWLASTFSMLQSRSLGKKDRHCQDARQNLQVQLASGLVHQELGAHLRCTIMSLMCKC